MRKVLVLLFVLSLFIFSCSSTPSSNVEFWNTTPKDNLSYNFYNINSPVGATFDYKNTVIATLKGNELTLIDPPIGSSGTSIQYHATRGSLYNTSDTSKFKEGVYLDLVESVNSKGIASDWIFIYVTGAGSVSITGHRWQFPEAGWYAATRGGVFSKLEPPHFTPPAGLYWVVIDYSTKEVLWWKN